MTTSISDALFTRTQQKVLTLLYGRLDESFYLNQIVRLAGIGKGTVKRELESMVAAGLITVTAQGNQNHYQANPECPIYEELGSIVRKTFGIADEIRQALQPVAESIMYACVYGSIAKGEERAGSDVDLLMVGEDLDYAEVMELLVPLEQSLGRTVNPTLLTPAAFQRKRVQVDSFLARVMAQPRIGVLGSEDGLD